MTQALGQNAVPLAYRVGIRETACCREHGMAGDEGVAKSSEADVQPSGAPAPVFISYASQDAEGANAVIENLEQHGCKCWIAPRDVPPGSQYADEIVAAINDAKVFVLVLSENALVSAHVGRELERAASKRRRIIVLRTDAAPLTRSFEYFLSESQWIDVAALGVPAALRKLTQAVGQRLAPLSWVSPGLGTDARDPADRKRKPSYLTIKRLVAATVFLVVAVVVVGVMVRYWPSMHRGPQAPVVAAIADKSIAVLPFTDMSEKHDQEYFADGMAEEIQNILAKLPQLRVLGRASSFQFEGSTDDVRTVGSKLGAAYVVSGGVSKAGSRIRVTAQLIDARSGGQLWSERYDREFNDILVLQDEIATAIARALRVTVSARDARPLGDAREEEAYTLYLKGKLALDSFDTNSLADAQGDFEQALVLNPALVAAAEGMALMWRWRVIASDIPALEGIEKARSAAEKSLSMDSRSSVTHEVLGFVAASRDFDWSMAETEIQKALALNPNDPEILEVYAEILWPRGLINEATKQLHASLTLDPLNANTLQTLSIPLFLNRDYAAAVSALRKSLAINPTIDSSHYLVGVIQLLSGRNDEALKEFAAENKPLNRYAGSALVNFSLGNRSESDAALARLIREGAQVWPYGIATVFAHRGEKNDAFEWLEKAYTARDYDLQQFVRGDPLLMSLHGDVRWAALLRKMHLAP
jgi:TolB-like protein